MNDNRIASFDIAKTIALFGVLLGHTLFLGVPQSIVDFFYSFDMPLFFIVSGYFCKRESLSRSFVFKNARGLLIPYIFTSIVIIICMTCRAFFVSDDPAKTAIGWTVAALYGSGDYLPGMPTGVIAIGAIWYLLALFWGKLLLVAANESKYPFLIVLALFVVGVSTADKVWLPLSIQPALCATLFIFVGQVIREAGLLKPGSIHPLIWFCMLMTWLYCGAFFGQLYMVRNLYAHGAMDVIGGVCGSLCVIRFGEIASRRIPIVARPLEFVGRNTLPLFCMYLVELTVVDWGFISTIAGSLSIPLPMFAMLIHMVLMTVFSLLLYVLPRPLSAIFYSSRRVVTS